MNLKEIQKKIRLDKILIEAALEYISRGMTLADLVREKRAEINLLESELHEVGGFNLEMIKSWFEDNGYMIKSLVGERYISASKNSAPDEIVIVTVSRNHIGSGDYKTKIMSIGPKNPNPSEGVVLNRGNFESQELTVAWLEENAVFGA